MRRRSFATGIRGVTQGMGSSGPLRTYARRSAPPFSAEARSDRTSSTRSSIELDGTEDKSALGANAILAVSTAAARAAAVSEGIPLWRYLGGGNVLPLPMVNIISGGLHAASGLIFQDFLVVPVGAESFREALESVWAVRAATAELLHERGLSTLKAAEGGFGPPLPDAEAALDLLAQAVARSGRGLGDEVAFAIDVAASHFFDEGLYRVPGAPDGLDAAALVGELERLVRDYPVVSIEDGLAEDDWEGWALLTERLASRIQIIGDDLFTTSPTRVARGIAGGVANSVLVKMNQVGTLSETLDRRPAGTRRTLCAGDLRKLRRDERRFHRRPGSWNLGRADQDRFARPV